MRRLIMMTFVVLHCGTGGAWALEPRPLAPEPHPHTAERGSVQVEFSPLSYAYDRRHADRADRRTHRFTLPLLAKVGLTHHMELHVGGDLFFWQREEERPLGTRQIDRGVGDAVIGIKQNLWGNDGGPTALALRPFVHLPTQRRGWRDGAVEGGLLVPMAWMPDETWTLEWTPGFTGIYDDHDDRHRLETSSLVVVNYALMEAVDVFIDFEARLIRHQPWEGLIGTGVTWQWNDKTIIEPAVHFGVTRAAEDLTVTLTLVRRF